MFKICFLDSITSKWRGQRSGAPQPQQHKLGDLAGDLMSSSLTSSLSSSLFSSLPSSSLLASKRGEAERFTELPSWCLRQSGVAGVEFTFLWAFPMWIFKPFSDLKVPSHWSHLNAFSGVWAFCFFFRNSSLLLASRLRVDGVFFFFGDARTSFPIENVRKIINPSPIDQSRLQWDYKRMSNPATIHWIGNQILGTCVFFNPDRIGPIIWQSTKNVAIRLQFQINPNLTAHRQVLGLESRACPYPCSRGLRNPTGRPQSPKGPFSES